MKLERFNYHGNFIKFEREHGTGTESMVCDGQTVCGVGDWLDSSFVALTVSNGEMTIHVDTAEFIVKDGWPKIRYFHNKNATTTCVIQDQTNSVELTYDSWWVSRKTNVPGLEIADDEDMDICAYLLLMTGGDRQISHLVKKYSQ